MKISGFTVPLLLLTGIAVAQTVETIPYRAVLSSANETPAVSIAASGASTVLVHVVRDAAGKVVSGSVDATMSYKFPGAVTITAMHIHNAPAGVAGPIVVPFAITRTDDAGGAGTLPQIQTQYPSTAVPLDIINGILADPSQFYFNVHTTDNPGGAIRGQLQKAEMIVRMGVMKPENETPPIPGTTYAGIGTTTAFITRDASGKPTSALVIFDVTYSGFPADTTFTGLHIHFGNAGVAGPVTINTGVRSVPADPSGSGSVHYEVEADVTQQAVLDTLAAYTYNPTGTYINIHTSVFPGGAVRSQLMSTDRMDFQVTMSPANEVPPLTLAASTPGVLNVYTVRNPDGTAAAGTVIFDANPRFPSGTTVSAMHIHDQVAGQNGPVTIDSGLNNSPVLINDGTGNVYRIAQVKTASALASLNDVIVNPDKHYVNLHTTANPGGATRVQLIPASTNAPKVTFVETGVQDPSQTTLAPGGLTLIAGTDLSKTSSDLSGFNGAASYPTTLNGVKVTIGGVAAPIYLVAPDRIFAQVPLETSAGPQPVVVTTQNGASAAYSVRVATNAPAVFINENGALAFKSADFSVVGPGNAARAGDQIFILATGMGQTQPSLQTGKVVVDPSATDSVTVRLGGQNVPVISSTTLPGLVGVYAVVVKVPTGLAAGNQPLQLQMGTDVSNTAALAIQ